MTQRREPSSPLSSLIPAAVHSIGRFASNSKYTCAFRRISSSSSLIWGALGRRAFGCAPFFALFATGTPPSASGSAPILPRPLRRPAPLHLLEPLPVALVQPRLLARRG